MCSIDPKFGLTTAGLFPGGAPVDPLNNGPGQFYIFESIMDASGGRPQYILYTALENNPSLMANDGGCCSGIYEAGPFVGKVCPTDLSRFPSSGGCFW